MGEGKERAASAGAKNCQPEELCARDNERGAYTGRLLRDPPRHGPTSVRGAEHRRVMPSKARWFHSGPLSELTTLARLDCRCDLLSYLPVSDEIIGRGETRRLENVNRPRIYSKHSSWNHADDEARRIHGQEDIGDGLGSHRRAYWPRFLTGGTAAGASGVGREKGGWANRSQNMAAVGPSVWVERG